MMKSFSYFPVAGPLLSTSLWRWERFLRLTRKNARMPIAMAATAEAAIPAMAMFEIFDPPEGADSGVEVDDSVSVERAAVGDVDDVVDSEDVEAADVEAAEVETAVEEETVEDSVSETEVEGADVETEDALVLMEVTEAV